MGNIPDFDPVAYAAKGPPERDLELLSIERLAVLSEWIDKQHASAKLSKRIASNSIGFDLTRADQDLARLKAMRGAARAVFVRKLKAQCGSLGYLVGAIVYRAQPDGLGIDRTILCNPPTEVLPS